MAAISDRSSAATASATGSCPLLRPAISRGFFNLAFDPDDGKNQDPCFTFLRGAIRDCRPPRRRIRWKFNDGAHFANSLRLPLLKAICGDGGH
jgi:hypothetical protein